MSTPFPIYELLVSERLYHLLATLAVVGILLWLTRNGRGRQPWSWAVAGVALAGTVAYAHVVPALQWNGSRTWQYFRVPVPLSFFELVLPVGALSLVTLVARDARPGIAAVLYVETHLAARLLPLIGGPFLGGGRFALETLRMYLFLDWQYMVLPLVLPSVLVLVTLTSTVVSYRRASDTP